MADESKFTKSQILKSKRYRDRVDLINALLKDDVKYSLEEVDKMIDKFMKKAVK